MSKYLKILLFINVIAFSQEYEDVVILKDGSEIHGIIIEQKPNDYIKIQSGKNTFVYSFYDIELMRNISSIVNIPIIASGGVGNLDHLVDGIKLGNASAVLAASIFHYGKHSVIEAKQYLEAKGIPVRI